MKKLVVFYSRADENYFDGEYRYVSVGNTEKLAQIIAKKIGADLFRLEQSVPYAKDYNTCILQAKKDLQNNTRPILRCLPEHMEQYNEIYLGYPNYWGAMPMAVYTFLESFDWSEKVIHPFCTHEGSGLGLTVKELRSICKGAKVEKGLAVTGSTVDNAEMKIEQWLA